MRLGYVLIWGKEKTSVNEVNLIYNGNKETVPFVEDLNQEVSDIRKCLVFFLNEAIQNVLHEYLIFLSAKET